MKRILPLALLIYVAVIVFLFHYLKYYADNPDTFQYISIAKKYSTGDWANAVNGYWSPLISWLLIVPLALFNDSILAFKILQILIGVFVLIQWNRFLNATSITNFLKNILTLIIIPFVADYALLNLTPDLLFIGITILTVNIMLRGRISNDRSVALKAGAGGGIMFLTKAFGLPLFISLSAVVFLYENKLFPVNRKAFIALLFPFAIISCVWIGIMSVHYQSFTINKSVSFNRSLSKAMLYGEESLPVLDEIIIPEPGQGSPWESPGVSLKGNEHRASLKDVIVRNLLSIYYLDFRRQTGLFFLAFLVMYIIRKKKIYPGEKWLFVSIVLLILFYVGYSLILVHSRYLWINSWLILMMGTFFIYESYSKNSLRVFFISLLIILSLKRPVKELLFITDKEITATHLINSIIHPVETLDQTYAPDKAIDSFIENLKKRNLNPGPVSSITNKNFIRDTYSTSNRIAQALGWIYIGQSDNFTSTDSESQRRDQIIPGWQAPDYPSDYLISYGKVKRAGTIYTENIYGMTLYSLKKLNGF